MEKMIKTIDDNIKELKDIDIEKIPIRDFMDECKEFLIDIMVSFKYIFERIEKREEIRKKQYEEIIDYNKKKAKDSIKYFT